MAPLILYTADTSPPSYAILTLIEALGLKVENRLVDLTQKEQYKQNFLKINSQHIVPTLIDEDFTLWDSHAIATYLISKYGKNDALYPKDLKKRAMIDRRLHFDSSILYPHVRNFVSQLVIKKRELASLDEIEEVLKGYEFLEEFLSDSEWVAGNEMTVADISLSASVNMLNCLLPVDKAKYPKVVAWLNKCKALPIYKDISPRGYFIGNLIKEVIDKTLATKK